MHGWIGGLVYMQRIECPWRRTRGGDLSGSDQHARILATESGGNRAERYSPAVRFYLAHHWGEPEKLGSDAHLQAWMRNFFTARTEHETARDIPFLFLHLHLDDLRRLYILDQPCNRNLAPRGARLQACPAASGDCALQLVTTFSQ